MPVDAEYLKSQIREIRETIRELQRLSSKPYKGLNSDEKYSMRYQVVVLAEALGSLCLHIAAEDFKCEPESYSECFSILEKRGLTVRARDLIAIARLRNLVVHRYWVVDDAKIYETVKENFECVRDLLERVTKNYGL